MVCLEERKLKKFQLVSLEILIRFQHNYVRLLIVEDGGWSKQTNLYPIKSVLSGKSKTLAFQYDQDILCRVEMDDGSHYNHSDDGYYLRRLLRCFYYIDGSSTVSSSTIRVLL